MSSRSFVYVPPPDIYHRLGLSGMSLAKSAMDIRAQLVRDGKMDEIAQNERFYLDALQEGFDQIASLKAQALARVRPSGIAETDPKAVVSDKGIGKPAIGGKTSDGHAVAIRAYTANARSARADAGAVDFSASFTSPNPKTRQTPQEYLAQVRSRVDALLPLSKDEHERYENMRTKVIALMRTSRTTEELQRLVEPDLVSLERDLSHGGASRAEVYASYLALCRLLREMPKQIGFREMVDESRRLEAAVIDRRLREEIASQVTEAFAEVGLKDAGTTILDGRTHRLLVDKDETDCALAVFESPDGTFMFTTVSSQEPSSASGEERARIASSAKRLCAKKERLVEEALFRRGIVASVRFDSDVDLSLIRESTEFAKQTSVARTSAQRERQRRENTTSIRERLRRRDV